MSSKSTIDSLSEASMENNVQSMASYNSVKWGDKGANISREYYKEIMQYGRDNNIELIGFKQYDGGVDTVKEIIDNIKSVVDDYPILINGRKKISIELDYTMNDEDFATTLNHIVHINGHAYRNLDMLEEEYQKLVKNKWFAQGTDHNAIIIHEAGHVLANLSGIDPMGISVKLLGMKPAQVVNYVYEYLSQYSAEFLDGSEIIAECFASYYNSIIENSFVDRFMDEINSILK